MVERVGLRGVRMFPPTAATAARGTNMEQNPGHLRRGLTVCLAMGSVLGALFGLALMAASVTGESVPSSILMGGCGFIFLAISVPVFISAIRSHCSVTPKSGSGPLRGITHS